jgi:hypothetical protein
VCHALRRWRLSSPCSHQSGPKKTGCEHRIPFFLCARQRRATTRQSPDHEAPDHEGPDHEGPDHEGPARPNAPSKATKGRLRNVGAEQAGFQKPESIGPGDPESPSSVRPARAKESRVPLGRLDRGNERTADEWIARRPRHHENQRWRVGPTNLSSGEPLLASGGVRTTQSHSAKESHAPTPLERQAAAPLEGRLRPSPGSPRA